MRKRLLVNSLKAAAALLLGAALFTLNTGCEGNTAQAAAGQTTITVQTESNQTPETPLSSSSGIEAAGSQYDQWDPFVWMQEFRREMERSFEGRYNPFGDPFYYEEGPSRWLRGVQNEMDYFFDRSRSRWIPDDVERSESIWTPQVDMYDDENNIIVRVDLPGMEKEGIEITVTGNILTIAGEKRQEKEIKKEDYRRFERSYGAFQRSIMLPPDADTDRAVSSYENGVLEIKLPKKAVPQKKRISLS